MVFYFVQKGETLYTIAKRYQTTVHAIVAANRLEDPNAICPGQALIIPRPGEVPLPPPGGIVHLVRPGETIFHLAAKFVTRPQDILRANQIAHPEFILPGQQLVIPERLEAGDDWPMLGRTPGRAGAGPVALYGSPAEGWSHIPRKSGVCLPSAPVVRYERVFVGLGDGYFYSLDRHTGRLKWRVPAVGGKEPETGSIHGLAAPAVFDGLAYLCGPDGAVSAVDAYTGQPIWRIATGGMITSSPSVSDGVVYVGSWDGSLYALEAKTGAIAWQQSLGSAIVLPVAVGDERVFATTAEGRLVALDAYTGEEGWRAEVAPHEAPVFAEVVLLAGERAYDPKNGEVLWAAESMGPVPVAKLDQVIYPGGVVDLFTGTLRQSATLPAAGPALLPEGEADTEAISGEEGPAGREAEAEPGIRAQVVTGPMVISVATDQRVYGRDLQREEPDWAIELPVQVWQPPAVAPGQLFLTLGDGSLRSFYFRQG